jgi:hypothetical protein
LSFCLVLCFSLFSCMFLFLFFIYVPFGAPTPCCAAGFRGLTPCQCSVPIVFQVSNCIKSQSNM